MSASNQTVDILFFGDIVGRPGRRAVKWYLSSLSETERPDIVIANAENASHGFGLTEKNYYELLESGIDIMTGGNHIWDRKEILEYIPLVDRLLRPDNFPSSNPGTGARVFDIRGIKVGVINLIGQVFMGNYNSPWERIDQLIPEMQHETSIIFVDYHAEATAEKISFGRHASTLGLSIFVGTHTHVQTSDEKILNHHTGYITDAGFCGVYDSVIGMQVDCAIDRLKSNYPTRLDVAEGSVVQVNGCRFTVEVSSGACKRVSRVNVVHDLQDDEIMSSDSLISAFQVEK